MNKQELTIGSWVSVHGNNVQVTGMANRAIFCRIDGRRYLTPYRELQPISMSTEWAKEIGLQLETQSETRDEYYLNAWARIIHYKDNNEWNLTLSGVSFDYVHQIQALVTLMGEKKQK